MFDWNKKPTFEDAWDCAENMWCYVKNTIGLSSILHHIAFDGRCVYVLGNDGETSYYAPSLRYSSPEKFFETFKLNKERWYKEGEVEFIKRLNVGLCEY